jgi:surfeit locus 1 family protein
MSTQPDGIRLGPFRFSPGLWPTLAYLALLPLLLGLGLWQLDRAEAKEALIERRASSETAAPVDLDRATTLSQADRYRAATVTGRYLADQQWLLDNRLYHGTPGYHVFTPFVIAGDDRPRLLVNRGWVAVGESRDDLPRLPLPDGQVVLRGRLDSPASVGIVLGEPPLGSPAERIVVLSLDLADLAAAKDWPLVRYALVLDGERPGALQYDWSPIPPMGPEKHLGYALQWFAIAVALTLIYIGVNTRRDTDRDGDGGGHVRA